MTLPTIRSAIPADEAISAHPAFAIRGDEYVSELYVDRSFWLQEIGDVVENAVFGEGQV